MKRVSANLLTEVTQLVRKGESLIESGDNDLALEVLYEALHLDPKNSRIINDIGVALLLMGDHDEAARVFGIAIQVDPQNQAAVDNLVARRGQELVDFDGDEAALVAEPSPSDDPAEKEGGQAAEEVGAGPAVRAQLLAGVLDGESRVLVAGVPSTELRLRLADHLGEVRSVALRWLADDGAGRGQHSFDSVLLPGPFATGDHMSEFTRAAASRLRDGGVVAAAVRFDAMDEAWPCPDPTLVEERRIVVRPDGEVVPFDRARAGDTVILVLRRGQRANSTRPPATPSTRPVVVLEREESSDPVDRLLRTLLAARGLPHRVIALAKRSESEIRDLLEEVAPSAIVAPIDPPVHAVPWLVESRCAGIPVLLPERGHAADRVRLTILDGTECARPGLASVEEVDPDLREYLADRFLERRRRPARAAASSGVGVLLPGPGDGENVSEIEQWLESLPEDARRSWWIVRELDKPAIPVGAPRDREPRQARDVLAEAEVGLADVSPLALALVAEGRPVVVTGRPFFAGYGFARRAGKHRIAAELASAGRDPNLSPEEASRADRFFYHLLFEVSVRAEPRELGELLEARLASLRVVGR